MVLNARTYGWRDLAVRVAGGGARPHMARVRHGRITYESNPSLAAALPRHAAGRVVIPAHAGSRRLF
jgi:hypothetical protein